MKKFINKSYLGLTVLAVVLALIAAKFVVHQFGWELLSINALFTSAIGGAVFIMGFLLAGVFADYKEAEKAPAELRSALESIWEDGKMFGTINKEFNINALRGTLITTIQRIFSGLSHENGHTGLNPALESLEDLSPVFLEMERLGMPANHVVRLKSERSAARKILLRISHIQRIDFVPSVYFLAESLVCIVIVLMLLLTTEGSPESFILFGVIAYLFIYVARLIRVLEKPFRQGHNTRDDVSLFLLHEFEEKLGN